MNTIKYSCGHDVQIVHGREMPRWCYCGRGEMVGAKGQFYMSDPVRAKLREAMMNVSPLKEDPMTSEEQLGTPDWTIAPEGATHYQPQQHVFYKRIAEHDWKVWGGLFDGKPCWRHSPGTSDSALWVKRPVCLPGESNLHVERHDIEDSSGWDGTGYPPVGWHGQVKWGNAQSLLECVVLPGKRLANFIGGEWSIQTFGEQVVLDFQPLPTKEMREREEAVGAALQTIQRKVTPAEHTLLSGFAMRLHDAGMLIKAAE